jgi:hypothetical protein
MNKYAKYTSVIASVGAFGIVALEHPHAHIEQSHDTAAVASTATSNTSGPVPYYKTLTVGQGTLASLKAAFISKATSIRAWFIGWARYG